MLTREQLRHIHGPKLPLHILELDYIQSLILKEMFKNIDTVVFKGGTCLRMTLGLNRFSEDLDFNLISKDYKKILEISVLGLKKARIESRLGKVKEIKGSYLTTLRYRGPLYDNSPVSEGSLRIDLSSRKTYQEPVWSPVLSPYADAGTFNIKSMAPEEILAEKFRALEQRRKPRDLYDTWFLLRKGQCPSDEMIGRKLEETGSSPRSLEDIIQHYPIEENEWSRDLKNLIEAVPDLETIKNDIISILSE